MHGLRYNSSFLRGFSPHIDITAAYFVCHAIQNLGVMILSLELLPQLQRPPIPPPLLHLDILGMFAIEC
jgi:hypothetical protein